MAISKVRSSLYLVVVAAALGASGPMAYAQPPQPRPGETPGAETTRLKTELERKRRALEEKEKKPPKIEVEEEKKAPFAEGVTFTLKEVRITGSTVFKADDFKVVYAPYLGKEVTSKELGEILDRAKAKYKEKGYLTTTAYFPEQEIRDGIIEIMVLEGKMGELRVEGTKYFPASLIKKYFHSKKNELLNIQKLERDIVRLNKNPDIEVRTVISPGAEPGSSDVVLTVKDRFPYHPGAGFDNHGSRLIGKDRTILSFRSSNLTANNDSFFSGILFSRDANAQSVSYQLPVDTYGTKLCVDYSHFNQKLGKEFKAFDITGDSKVLTPYISKELYLSEAAEGYFNIGIDIKSVKQHNNGVTLADDQLRVPFFGFEFTNNDAWGMTTFSPRFGFGTGHFLGASTYNHPTAARAETGGFFFKYSHEVVRAQRMFLGSYAVIRSQFQASTRTLSPSEQLQIGGSMSVRGYPEGDFLADTGAILNIDWIFPMYLLPETVKLPYADVPLRRQIEPVLFMDMGGGRLNKAEPLERRDKFLMGIGGGVRVRLYRNIFCRFEWAKDIGAKPTTGAGPSSFHVSIQTEL